MKNILVVFILLLTFCSTIPNAIADSGTEPEHSCWNSPPPEIFASIENGAFTSFTKGSETDITVQSPNGTYTMHCRYTQDTQDVNENSSSFWTKAVISSSLVNSDINPGYYKLSDDVDAKIYVYDNVGTPVLAPFTDDHQTGGGTITPNVDLQPGNYNSGSKIKLTLKLRKDVVGGAFLIPQVSQMMSLYRRFGTVANWSYSPYASQPVMSFTLQSSIITVPTDCTINNGEAINVNFGNIDSSWLTAVSTGKNASYDVSKLLNYHCQTPLSQDVMINLNATPVSFSSQEAAIATSKSDIGVVMKHNGVPVVPGSGFTTHFDSGTGNDVVTFSVIKSPDVQEVQPGAFSASATLIITAM